MVEPMAGKRFSIRLERERGYRLRVDFDPAGEAGLGERLLTVDEGPPLGEGAGPSPERLLASAVGSCLAASLLYCLERAHAEVEGLAVEVSGTVARNAQGRLRIAELAVDLQPQLANPQALERCASLFEQFCTVTESVRSGIEVRVGIDGKAVDRGQPLG